MSVKSFFTHLESVFGVTSGTLTNTVSSLITNAQAKLSATPPDAVTIVQKSVAAAELNGGTGSDKKESALKMIADGLVSAAIQLEPYVVNVLLELAVTELKAVAA